MVFATNAVVSSYRQLSSTVCNSLKISTVAILTGTNMKPMFTIKGQKYLLGIIWKHKYLDENHVDYDILIYDLISDRVPRETQVSWSKKCLCRWHYSSNNFYECGISSQTMARLMTYSACPRSCTCRHDVFHYCLCSVVVNHWSHTQRSRIWFLTGAKFSAWFGRS